MDFVLPPVGEGLFEVELIRWLVKPGETIKRGQSLMEVMSDKASMEVPAPFEGTIQEIFHDPGVKVKVGQLILKYGSGDSSIVTTEAATVIDLPKAPAVTAAKIANGAAAAVVVEATPSHKLPPAAPSVRLLARKLGMDLARIRGSGPAGRVMIEDLTAHLEKAKSNGKEREERKEKSSVPKMDYGVAGTKTKMIGMRRKVAEKMAISKRTIPHFAYVDECDLSDLVRLRSQLKENFTRVGVRITYLPFFVKAVCRALKEIPIANCTYDEATEEMTLHDRYNIGVAVAVPTGLMVPVIRDVDKRDIASIAREIERLSSDARAGRSKLDDLRGGTFTVTSIGGIGGLISTPIINHPEVGIMGIGKTVKRPVYDENGQLRPAEMVYLSFSFDHRVVDGAVGAVFGNAVIRHLSNPASLLLPDDFA